MAWTVRCNHPRPNRGFPLKEEGDKPKRHATMQVDLDDLYAALEAQGGAPPPLPPPSSPPKDIAAPTAPSAVSQAPTEPGRKNKVLLGSLIAIVVAAAAAYLLSELLMPTPAAAPDDAGGTMEVGPIELSD